MCCCLHASQPKPMPIGCLLACLLASSNLHLPAMLPICQMNKAIRAQGRTAFLKLGDMLIEDYLAFISTHIKRCFFQDLPFLWEHNKHHGIFQHPFFQTYQNEWAQWCQVHLAYNHFMEKVRCVQRDTWQSLGINAYGHDTHFWQHMIVQVVVCFTVV